MKKQVNHKLHSAVLSGLAYGFGLTVGIALSRLFFTTLSLTDFAANLTIDSLGIGLFVALVIVGFGAAAGGYVGGITLPIPANSDQSRWGLAWRSGLSLGTAYGFLFFPLGLAIVLFSFYTISEISTVKFDLLFAVFGLLFGALAGFLLGLLTIGRRPIRRTLQVVGVSSLGFGLGGFVLGNFIRRYLLSITLGDLRSGQTVWLVVGFLLFGMAGGAALGIIYRKLALAPAEKEPPPLSRTRRIIGWGIGLVAFIGLLFVLDPLYEALADVLTPEDPGLAYVLDTETRGTHWSEPVEVLAGDVGQPDIAAGQNKQMGLVWSQGTDVYWAAVENGELETAINVSNSVTPSTAPQIVVDNSGSSHLVWVENGTDIFYTQCQDTSCLAPVQLSDKTVCATNATNHTAPVLAINDDGMLLAVWQTDTHKLLYRTFPEGAVECVPVERGGQPRIVSGPGDHFILTYNSGAGELGTIHTIAYENNSWELPTSTIGEGMMPEIFLDTAGKMHVVWCGLDNRVHYGFARDDAPISDLPCGSRPALVQDGDGVNHVIWYSDVVKNGNGRVQPHALLYESILLDGEWTAPVINRRVGQPIQPAVAAGEDGRLHLAGTSKTSASNTLNYTTFTPYTCDEFPLTGISQVAYETARNPIYRPSDALIPYCQNRYDRLSFMPNPNPAYSAWPSTTNGGFDDMAALAKTAEYEVLFSTMWYEDDQNQDSPGYVFVEGVAELYQKLKQNPENFPRGLTVRILLGNPPELELGNYSSQIWYVLSDLRDAGIDTMEDPEIGWRMEVANFDGALPHSHSKVVIVDGKTILAAGFNMQYEHYAEDHPSGQGQGRQDLGIQVTGPVAQDSHRMYDDLWEGSHQQICSNFFPSHGIWQATCRSSTAISDHVPEVMRYFLPSSGATTFSLYRSEDHDEADQIVANGLAAAQESVDAMHVMFTMEMICDLNLLFKLCDFGESTEFLASLMQAAQNGAKVRLIVKPQPTDGIESFVAIDVFKAELAERGISEQVEIRLFNDPVHYKTTLIDNEFLIVGSQNFHYSAYGAGQGLTEYSLGVHDHQAIEDYRRLFAYHWQRADLLQ